MQCHHCHLEIEGSPVRCPHCGTPLKLNPFVKLLRGWGIVDLIVLLITIAGIGAFIWVYLGYDITRDRDIWHVEAQAYEEVIGQVKVIGTVKNLSGEVYDGGMTLELRAFNSENDLVYSEVANAQAFSLQHNAEMPFSFVIQRPRDFAFFNVIAQPVRE